MRRILRTAALATLGVLLSGWQFAAPVIEPLEGALEITPARIQIGMLYDGARIRLHGAADAGSDIIVVIRGPDHEESFNKKVRAGPIWISSGQVHISGAPSLFLSYATAPVESILSPENIARYRLSTEAIEKEMTVHADGEQVDVAVMAANYTAMRSDINTYQVHNGTIDTSKMASGGGFSLELDWPRTAQPATYEVASYECRSGAVHRIGNTQLEVVKMGTPAEIYAFAMDSSAQYGALAVLIAVLAGFGIDFLVSRIFRAKVRSH